MHLRSLPQCCSLLFIILHYHIFCSFSEPTCHPDERSALLQFNLTNSWNKSEDCCTWDGVKCDRTTGQVTGLHLPVFHFHGELPAFPFPKLQELYIGSSHYRSEYYYDNQIQISELVITSNNFPNLKQLELIDINMSSVPLVSLLNLSSSLTYLSLDNCLLNGELPNKFFASFPKLEYLNLVHNNISGQIPKFCSTNSTTNVGNLSSSCVVGSPSNLTYIDLSQNSIHGPIPAWIFALPYLESLALNDNHFSGEIGNFQTSSLKSLWLRNNQLSGVIPRSIFRQTKLRELHLHSNNLTGIVEWEELSELQDLVGLYLSFNNLTLLSFNNSVKFALPKLRYVGLASCHLVEFPPFFRFGFKNGFIALDLSNNHLKGRVPSWFLLLAKRSFGSLNLSHNSLTYFDPLLRYELQYLDLHSNSFTGPLPTLYSRIFFFLASKNQFSGAIPNSFCNFTSIFVLDLSFNNLTGEIPRCIGNLSNSLSVLDLRHNKLHGTISAKFAKGNRLRSLNLNGNQLEGRIPRSLGNCKDLEVLDLGNNMLNDTFPDWLESLPSLQVLVLRANKFHGSIGNPKSRSPFFNLRIMDLSRNDFTGDLPSNYFKSFNAIQTGAEKVQAEYMGGEFYQDSVTVSVKGNDIVMDKILTIFSAIDFSRNNFSGEIPQILGKLVSLKGLNLSHNMLGGTIPSSLGNLKNLEWLDLCSNRLVREIPTHLADLTFLSKLNLSYNRLEGLIPHGQQFNTFPNDSFVGNLDLCGFPLSKLCREEAEPSLPKLEQDEDGDDSSITNGFNWRIVMMGYASGLVIGISIGYMLLYSNGKLWWLSYRIMDEIEYIRRARRRNARRSTRRS